MSLKLTGVSLARDALLNARLLAGGTTSAAAAAATLAESVLGFVDEARHVCGVVCCLFWV